MRKLMFLIASTAIISCNTAEDKNAATDSTKSSTSTGSVSYASPIMYSSQFEMGDSKNGQTIVSMWKDFDDNNLNNSKNMFADTVDMFFPGMSMHVSRDSAFSSTQAYRDGYSKVSSRVDVVLSTRSTDKNEDWVAIWGTETKTDKAGKTDSVRMHEIWRFNKDGKIDYLSQFIQPQAPMK